MWIFCGFFFGSVTIEACYVVVLVIGAIKFCDLRRSNSAFSLS